MDAANLSPAVHGVALVIPVSFAAAAALVSKEAPLRRLARVAGGALGLAAIVSGLAAARAFAPGGGESRGLGLVRVDVITCVMLTLVCGIAAAIARYSKRYLDGEPGLPRYARWLSATLAAVTSLLLARNLGVIAIAWVATSVTLHQLLTFYGDRTQAILAAHKKFLLSRLADACLVISIALVRASVGSLDLDAIEAFAKAPSGLTPGMQIAAVFLVMAVALRSAQLPFHGWLTQVMEAPTPVSALLHAGVVNIGGLVMIRLAPMMVEAKLAQGLLVACGLTTTILGALVMSTRVSVKVALAWSTCAQMGFMLVQCGLGAYHLALLHLVAHSLYKAHAFLSAGSAVDVWREQALSLRPRVLRGRAVLSGAALGACAAAGTLILAGKLGVARADDPSLTPLAVVLGLSLAPITARGFSGGARSLAKVAGASVAVATLYFGMHEAAVHFLPVTAQGGASALGWSVVLAAFAALFVVQTALFARPDGLLARALHPWLFAAFYLDERFTRMTFRVWPPSLPSKEAPAKRFSIALASEA